MAKRRPLVAGLKGTAKTDPKKEAAFVYQKPAQAPEKKSKPKTEATSRPPAAEIPEPPVNRPAGRSPLTTKLDMGQDMNASCGSISTTSIL